MRKVCLFLIVGLLFCEYSFAGAWYKGGTLHDSTLKEWYKASYQNRLATCADWIVILVDKKNHGILFRDNMKVLRNLSEALEKCITDGNKQNGKIIFPSMKSTESGFVCWKLIQSQIK